MSSGQGMMGGGGFEPVCGMWILGFFKTVIYASHVTFLPKVRWFLWRFIKFELPPYLLFVGGSPFTL